MFNKYFSAELGWAHTGASASGNLDSLYVAGVAELPLSDAFSLQAKLGFDNTRIRLPLRVRHQWRR